MSNLSKALALASEILADLSEAAEDDDVSKDELISLLVAHLPALLSLGSEVAFGDDDDDE